MHHAINGTPVDVDRGFFFRLAGWQWESVRLAAE